MIFGKPRGTPSECGHQCAVCRARCCGGGRLCSEKGMPFSGRKGGTLCPVHEHDACQRRHVTDGSGGESGGRAAAEELREQLRGNGTEPESTEGREKMLPGMTLRRTSYGLGERVLRHVPVPGIRKERCRAGQSGVQLRQGGSSFFKPDGRSCPRCASRMVPGDLRRRP